MTSAERVVAVLTENDDISPEELLREMPELLVRYQFVPTHSEDHLEVKRWEKGSYYYLGTIQMFSNQWAPRTLAPLGSLNDRVILGVTVGDLCGTRREAAQRLWGIFKAHLDAANRK